jgi:hypothetical protein
MPVTEEQDRLARSIHQHVQLSTANGGGDEALLVSMYDHMGTFKQLMDGSTEEDMNQLCERYPGFYRFGKLLERLAAGIANSSIPVPK